MPVNCTLSFATELLAENQNIVRLPAKPYAQVDLICPAVKEVLDEQPEMKPYVVFVNFRRYRKLLTIFLAFASSVLFGAVI